MSSIAKLKKALTTGQNQIFTLNTPHNRVQISWVGASTASGDTITVSGIDEDGDEILLSDIRSNDADGVYQVYGVAGPLVFEVQFPKIKVLFTEASGTAATLTVKVKSYCTNRPPSPSWRPYVAATASPQDLKTDYV